MSYLRHRWVCAHDLVSRPMAGSISVEWSAREPADGRVAVVSGGNRGLGPQIVRKLAERGMRVVLATGEVESGRLAIELLGELANRVVVRQLDITDQASVARLADWTAYRLGRCDVLVNNAAIVMDGDDDPTRVDLAVVRRTLETNLLGTWRLTQSVVSLMRERRYGRVVNVVGGLGSLASIRRRRSAYEVATTAVDSLTRMLAGELAGDGILVNACCPGPARGDARYARRAGRASRRWFASADTPVWLATLPADGPTGGFHCERTPTEW